MVERQGLVVGSPDNPTWQLLLPNMRQAIEQLEPESQRLFDGMIPLEIDGKTRTLLAAFAKTSFQKEVFYEIIKNFAGILWEKIAYPFVLTNLGEGEVLTSPGDTKLIYYACEAGNSIGS